MCILPDFQSSSSRELSELVCAAGERGRRPRASRVIKAERVTANQRPKVPKGQPHHPLAGPGALNGWAPFGRPRCVGYGKAPLAAALALCARASARAGRPRQEAAAA